MVASERTSARDLGVRQAGGEHAQDGVYREFVRKPGIRSP
jgi:hypothetical protein